MRATDLSELAAFDAVARHRSFRKAGEERGVTASAISHAVSNLEARVGIRLLNRTTRSVSLTDAGAMLLAQLSPPSGRSDRRWTRSISFATRRSARCGSMRPTRSRASCWGR